MFQKKPYVVTYSQKRGVFPIVPLLEITGKKVTKLCGTIGNMFVGQLGSLNVGQLGIVLSC